MPLQIFQETQLQSLLLTYIVSSVTKAVQKEAAYIVHHYIKSTCDLT